VEHRSVNKRSGSVTMQYPRHSRLLRPREFRQVFKQPLRSSDSCFRILARSNELQRHRLGMAVAKKAVPKAVGRNRIKRVIRESFRAQMVGEAALVTLDIVVLPTALAAQQSNQVLSESLTTQWQKLINKAGAPGSARQSVPKRIIK
jgi:ribonuclease P protein component